MAVKMTPKRHATRLTVTGQRLVSARIRQAAALAACREAAIEAHEAGLAQAEIARLLGVDRMSVRAWIGKR